MHVHVQCMYTCVPTGLHHCMAWSNKYCRLCIFSNLFQIFWDLASLSAYQQDMWDMSSPLEIKDNEALGKGGFGFVCKGELILEVHVCTMYMYSVVLCVCTFTCTCMNVSACCSCGGLTNNCQLLRVFPVPCHIVLSVLYN